MKRSIAVFLLFVFCISLPGYSIEVHFCKGKITDIAFFGDAACHCETPQTPATVSTENTMKCHKHCHEKQTSNAKKSVQVAQKKCCKTQHLTLTSSKLKAFSSVKTNQVVWMALAILNPYAVTERLALSKQNYRPYQPPYIDKDLTILNRVFII